MCAIPLITNTASILPIPTVTAKEIEKIIFAFIWRGHHERLAKEECYAKMSDGGLGVVCVRAKTRAHYGHTLMKQYLSKEGEIGSMTAYLTSFRLKFIEEPPPGPTKETPAAILKPAIETLIEVNQQIKLIGKTKLNDIYWSLVKKYWREPKILEKETGKEYKTIFKNIEKNRLEPNIKEHMILYTHNILPTKERLGKTRRLQNQNCRFCNEVETKEHITGCKLFQPARKWILRKIRDLEPTISATDEEILNLQIKPTSKNKRNSIVYMISNFQYQTWKIRRKTTTVGNITREICTKLNIKMKNLKLENTYKMYYHPWP